METAQNNDASLPAPPDVEGTVELSDAAAKRVAKILSSEATMKALRVSVEGGGCSGFSYKFDLTDS
ncbi:MAG: hypothetical protein AAFO73_08050, partial [Pseudomonadota bacterium]